ISHPLLLDVLRPWLRSDFCMALCDLAAVAFAIASSLARAAGTHTPGAAARSEAALSPGYAIAAPVCWLSFASQQHTPSTMREGVAWCGSRRGSRQCGLSRMQCL